MKSPEQILKLLLDRTTELERKRTRSLATQSWGTTIEVEGRLAEVKLIRKWLTEEPPMQSINKDTQEIQ